MWPVIFPVDASEPTHRLAFLRAGASQTSTIGSPKRVTRIGWPDFRTRSITAKQVALNFEMAIFSIPDIVPSSTTIVNFT